MDVMSPRSCVLCLKKTQMLASHGKHDFYATLLAQKVLQVTENDEETGEKFQISCELCTSPPLVK